MAGWDRPLQYFFLGVTRECACVAAEEDDCPRCDGEGQEVIYDNLRDKQLFMGRMTWDDVNHKLQSELTAWPPQLLPQLADDRKRDAGNEITDYEPIGAVRHEP
jgi:hypothetical protein